MSTSRLSSACAPTQAPHPLRLGLTGGIGSGKSTVARMLVQAGAVHLDADAMARALTAPGGAAIAALRQQFGEALIAADGALDRAAMRLRMLADPQAQSALEGIIHPLVRQCIDQQSAAAGHAPCLVYDIPLLAESHALWRPRLDKILVLDCSAASQIQRVMARSGWTEQTVREVIARQASRAQRQAIADLIILNEGITLEQLREQVLAAVLQWAPRLHV
jgi:dephospho-CoA kinase